MSPIKANQTEAKHVFKIADMRFICIDPTIEESDLPRYVALFKEAYEDLRRKGFAKIWYGNVFVERTTAKLNAETQSLYAKYGYKNLRETAGIYHRGDDTFVITLPPSREVYDTLIHELGHRYWYKFMKSANRARFNDLVRTNDSVAQIDYPGGSFKSLEPGRKVFDLKEVKQKAEALFNDFMADLRQMAKGNLSKDDAKRRFRHLTDDLDYLLDPISPRPFAHILDKAWDRVIKLGKWLELLSDQPPSEIRHILNTPWSDSVISGPIYGITAYIDKAWAEQGVLKPVKPVSDYGASNAAEAFAEAFAHYVSESDMDRDQIESFRSVLSSAESMAARVMRRYLLACAGCI